LFICPTCHGRGRVGAGETCPDCHGAGAWAELNHWRFSWLPRFDLGELWLDNFKKFWRVLVYGGLMLVSLVGLLAAVREVTGLFELDYVLRYFGSVESYWLWFWWSLLTDSMLLYRLMSTAQKRARRDWRKADELSVRDNKISWKSLKKWSSDEVGRVINHGWNLADKLGHQQLEPQHIFLALLNNQRVQQLFWRLSCDHKVLTAKTIASLQAAPKKDSSQNVAGSADPRGNDSGINGKDTWHVGLEAQKIFLRAAGAAYQQQKELLDLEDLLLSLAAEEGWVKEFLYSLEIDAAALKNVWLWLELNDELGGQRKYFRKMSRFRPHNTMNKAWTAVATPFLDQFSNDLTMLAQWGRLGLCVGRDAELDEVCRSFEAGQLALVLVGNPDVGKTAIIEGLAQRMVLDQVPGVLQDKRLVSLSLSRLVAGASGTGAIEERFRNILFEIQRAGNVVLLIDEIHNLVGMSTSGQLLDIAKFLSEALQSHNFALISTSNPVDYRRYLEGKNLGTMLKVVTIGEPDRNSTIQIMEAKAPYIEYHHGVVLTYGALKNTYDLADRYLKNYFLPKKALDLLEEAASWARRNKGKGALVTADDAAQVLSHKLGIPAAKITEGEADKLMNLEDKIHEDFIDQNEAVKGVAGALRRARAELRDIKKPIANFLFLGPTGVGKTELAKIVARIYFSAEDNMIRLDMSEYQEKNSVDRLLGAPGGTGGGILTEAVRLKPFALILLDEIEKAHPDILNLFLQVMDDGRMTDNEGRVADFSNCIIIATSNAGTQFIQDEIQKGLPVAQIKEILVREQLKTYFRPEFLNRFNEVVVFAPLGIAEIKLIASLLLKKLSRQLLDKGINLEVTPEALTELAQAGFDPLFGARPMKRAIEERVNNALAEYLLSGTLTRRDKVILQPGGKVEVKKAAEL